MHGQFFSFKPACLSILFRVAGRKVVTRVSRDGDAAGFRRMLVLTVAAPRHDEEPAVRFDQPEYVSDFHTLPVNAGGAIRLASRSCYRGGGR